MSGREILRHNPLNAVTASVERVHVADGSTPVRKELRRPTATDSGPWAGSDDPRHWNYWRREAEVYGSAAVRAGLHDTGLDLPAAEVEDGRVLWLEDVAGRPGTEFTLADHERFGSALGRWQARGPLDAPWTSRRFLWILASCVKYAWLLPGMLARAAATEQRAYHEIVDAEHLYRQRGLVLAHLVGWCDEALALLEAGR